MWQKCERLKGVCESRVEMEDHHYLRTSSRSCWSFFNKTDIQHDFTDLTWDVFRKEFQKTPITVVWNQHLPWYDSTCVNQEFKVFTCLSGDLVFKYGSLTDWRSTFRFWLGPDVTCTDVPGLEFFTSSGECQEETDWRTPVGKWFGQIFPNGRHLDTFEQTLLNFCQERGHEEDPDDEQEDTLEFDGHISLSSKGFHCVPQIYDYWLLGEPLVFLGGPSPGTVLDWFFWEEDSRYFVVYYKR